MKITRLFLKRITAASTAFFFTYACLMPAWADSITASAAEGNSVAQGALSAFSAPTLKDDSTLIFGSGDQAQTIKIEDIFPGATTTDTAGLENAFGDDDETIQKGNAANTRLASEDSLDGDAYRIIKGTAQIIRPDISNDPLWTNTDNIMANQDLFEKEFADCSKENSLKDVTLTKHIPDMKVCERINKPAGNCEIKHTVELEAEPTDMFFLVDNSGSMGAVLQELKVNVYKVAELLGIGKGEGNLRLGGAMTVGSSFLSNNIKLTDNIPAFQSWINSQSISSGETYNFAAVNWAVANNSWRENVNKVIIIIGNKDEGHGASPAAMLAAQGFKVFIFHDNGSIQSLGTTVASSFTAGGLFKVAQFLTIVKDKWEPADCIQAAKSTKDGFCTGEYRGNAGSGCANFSGFDVCPGDPIFDKLTAPPIPDVSKLDTVISVGAVSCPFNEGAMDCYTDAQGQQQCPENSENTCVVSHSLNIQEYPMVARVAVEDFIEAHETNRVVFDFVNGTYANTTRSMRIDGYVDKLDFNGVCKKGDDGKFLATKFELGSINLWTNHKFAPNTLTQDSVTISQMPSCDNGLQMVVNITDTANGAIGKFYAHEFIIKLLRLEAESWGPPECIAAAKRITDGTCTTGNIKVTKGVESGCLPYNGTSICPGDAMYELMQPSPIAGIDKLALNVRVEGCQANNLKTNTCEEFEKKGCGFISTQCVGNATGASGYCYVQDEVWDCGYDTEVKSAELETSYKCDGPVRCTGTECYSPVDEKSSDFAYAAAAMQITQFAENDLDCGDEATGSLDCKVWTGEFMSCKKALGGWVDCCEAPDGVSMMDYVDLTMNTLNAANKVGAFGQFAHEQGLWSYGEKIAEYGWSSISSSMPWGTAADAATSLSGKLAGDLAAENAAQYGTTSVIGIYEQQLMNYVAEWTANTFGPAAANTIFASGTIAAGPTEGAAPLASTGADGAVTTTGNATLGPMLLGALNVIMIAYLVYQIANILVQIIWECEPEEFELGAKKETKLCHFVGSYCASKSAFGCIEKREAYCCFNSPVGRIIQEQARPMLGQDWGDVENPSCGGLTIEEIGKVDWSKIDLSEWIGILNVTGHYPTIDGVSLNQLTGDGAFLSMDSGRDDTLERNQKRVEGMDLEQLRKEKEDALRANQ